MTTRIDLVEDVLPISELRLRAAQQISKIQETQRPLVITQYGKAVAVLMEVSQFQSWQDRLSLLEDRLLTLEKQLVARDKALLEQDRVARAAPPDRPADESA